MTENEIKTYQRIVTDYWNLMKKLIPKTKDDAFWSETVDELGKLQAQHKHRFSAALNYCVLDELDKVSKLNDMSDVKIYYNVMVDCGSAMKYADDFKAFTKELKSRFGKYNGNRFAMALFDKAQEESARLTNEKEGDGNFKGET